MFGLASLFTIFWTFTTPATADRPTLSKRSLELPIKKLAFLFLALACAASAAPYSKNSVHVLQQLRTNAGADFESDLELPLIDGCAVGEAGRPGAFFLLYPYRANRASEEDLVAMLEEASPTVRLMAAKVLLHSNRPDGEAKIADRLLNDPAKVLLAEYGCIIGHSTVGKIVKNMQQNKNFLGDRADKAIEPIKAFTEGKKPKH